MSTEQINIRIDADLVSALERVARDESTDRATVIRRLLERSLRQWEIDRAVEGYRRGDLSLGRAAEEAGVTQWELLELLHEAHVAYPLDVDDVAERIRQLRGEATPGESTLPDIPPQTGGVLLVGINPAPISVAAGHYYQGPIGRRLWRRLERTGLLHDPVPGREDEAFARAGHGLTDLVKRPTRSSAELTDAELEAGIDALRRKVRDWRPGLILFAFKEPARRLVGSGVRPGRTGEVEGTPSFLLTGPYAPATETERVDGELRALLGSGEPVHSDYEWSQRVTAKDIERGQIRLKQPARRFFPAGRARVEVVLRGARLRASYDPKIGPDRNRSPLLRIGRDQLASVVQPNEQFRVTRGPGGVAKLD
jgi:TDG/mug DNA glycosylase family protein